MANEVCVLTIPIIIVIIINNSKDSFAEEKLKEPLDILKASR